MDKIAIKYYYFPYEEKKHIYTENKDKSGIYC
jgi:hypothetical protein